ncbi:MAG: hypothetical protein EHM42_04940 [Planctomycetaceae bacterium]|nr:MAG: hypothetical protein EHM42_04940 [Planctomycetaceae bacterium]
MALEQFALASAGVVFMLVTLWMFAVALRRSHLRPSTAWLAGAVWVTLSAVVVYGALPQPTQSFTICVLLVGLMALVVAPLASMPLAIAVNRTR